MPEPISSGNWEVGKGCSDWLRFESHDGLVLGVEPTSGTG